jgi:hypothetical protein
MKLLLFYGFVNVYIHFHTWTRIRQKFRILTDPDLQHWYKLQRQNSFLPPKGYF